MSTAKFEIYMAKDNKWYWQLRASSDGSILADSGEGLGSVADCEQRIPDVVRQFHIAESRMDEKCLLVPPDPMLRLFQGYADDWKWALYSDGEGVFLASSPGGCDKESECRDAFDRFVQLVKGASVEAV